MSELDNTLTEAQNKMDWKNKRVFITGGTGFVGTHLCKRLIGLGAEIYVLSHIKRPDFICTEIFGDLSKSQCTVGSFLKSISPEVVFHLAAQPIVQKSTENECETIQTNILGTYNVLHACKDLHSVKSFVHISTDKVYGNVSPITKDTIPNGDGHPYNASKLAGDCLARTYSNFFGIPMVVIRNANVYGAGDTHFDRIVPRTIRRVFENKNPVVRGDGGNTRDYLHVSDVVDGYISAAELPYGRELSILNLGGFNHSVIGVVDEILGKMNRVDLAPTFEEQWSGEIPDQHIENDLAKDLIGWNPRTNLDQGLDKTINWYREYLREKR